MKAYWECRKNIHHTEKAAKRCAQHLAAFLFLPTYMAYAFTPLYSSEIVSFLRPLARRAANTRRPFAVAILSRNPCLFLLFLLEGWNVLFIFVYTIYVIIRVRAAKLRTFFK